VSAALETRFPTARQSNATYRTAVARNHEKPGVIAGPSTCKTKVHFTRITAVTASRYLLARTSNRISSLGLAALGLVACGEVKPIAPDASSAPPDAVQPVDAQAPIDAADAGLGALVTLAQSNTQAVRLNATAFCRKNGIDPPMQADNSYFRVLRLEDFDVQGDFQVADVQIGVESAVGSDGAQPAQVFLYTLGEGLELQRGNLELVVMENYQIPDQQVSIHTMPITATIPAGATLVVEFFVPDGSNLGDRFFVGCNNDGQQGPTYIEALSCAELAGIVRLDMAGAGFENRAVILNVRGYDLSRAP
jgi:hypothetical protein